MYWLQKKKKENWQTDTVITDQDPPHPKYKKKKEKKGGWGGSSIAGMGCTCWQWGARHPAWAHTHSSKLTRGEKTVQQSLLAGGGRGGGGPHWGGGGKQLLQPLPGQKLEQLIVQLGHVHVNIWGQNTEQTLMWCTAPLSVSALASQHRMWPSCCHKLQLLSEDNVLGVSGPLHRVN